MGGEDTTIRPMLGWKRKELWNLAAIGWAAALGCGALILEHGFGQMPCALCINQRAWALLAGLVVVAGFAHNPRLGIYPLLAMLASVIGGAFSIRHLYLIWRPPADAGCGVDFAYMLEVFPILDVLKEMTAGTGDCAEQGIAIPTLALVGFIGMIALCVTYWRQR
jgi:disulfide bond formation protein DsbB